MIKIDGLFFEFQYAAFEGNSYKISSSSSVSGEDAGYAEKYLKNVLLGLEDAGSKINIKFENKISDKVKSAVGEKFCEHEESYALEIFESEIILLSPSKRGLIYAVSTLYQLMQADKVQEGIIFDYPDKKVRGYRVYTPGKDSIPAFKKMIDMLLYYKYNSVIIEVGGAMEYKKHPEINEKWVEFCSEVNKSPYEARRIQFETFPWSKNSIHADNGGGSFISQEEMKDIIAYCREREIEVIPEVPSLSHSDYIVMVHPDLNERKEDTYPDTYCPSNPKSYEILFDIIDEVADVFNCEYMNIGHDEFYTAAKCDRCKGKNPVDLYVGDIVKINDYLKQKNIKAIMWCEKMFGDVYIKEGDALIPVGGTGDPKADIPRLAECAGRIPQDITLLQWYWSLCTEKMEQEVVDMGYKMLYGNYRAIALKDYQRRSRLTDGGYVSNWGSVEEEYMQRNGQNYSLITTAFIFWNSEYDDCMKGELNKKTKEELYERYIKSIGKDYIELEHTTEYFKEYAVFYDGFYIVPDDWTIGWHVVTYFDGTKAKLPVIYGYNIRSSFMDEKKDYESTESIVSSDIEVLGATIPTVRNGKIFYKTAYKNPYPEKEIKNITYISKDGIEVESKYSLKGSNI